MKRMIVKRIISRLKRALVPEPPSLLFGELDRYTDLISDEYVEHLRSVIGGWAVEGNIRAFECCIRNMPSNGAIVEIGSFLGLSTNIIAYAAWKYKRQNTFFTCDPWRFAGSDKPKAGYFSTGSNDYREWVMSIFRMNLSLFSPTFATHTIEAFSDEFFEMWESNDIVTDFLGNDAALGGPISFAYVDGNHSYEGGKRDFLNVDRFLVEGGYLMLDDSSDDSSYKELVQLVSEISKKAKYELVLKAPNYCFRKTTPPQDNLLSENV